MPSEKSDPPFILDDILRNQLDPTGIDLDWLQAVRDDAEQVIEALRKDPDFASALPAFSVWPELTWRKD